MKKDIFSKSTGEPLFTYLVTQDYNVGSGAILGDDGKMVLMEQLKPKEGEIIEAGPISEIELGNMSVRGVEYQLKTSVDKTKIIIPEDSIKPVGTLPETISDKVTSGVTNAKKNIVAGSAVTGAIAGLISAFMLKKPKKQYIYFALGGAGIIGLIGWLISSRMKNENETIIQ